MCTCKCVSHLVLSILVALLTACASYDVQDIYKPVGAPPEYQAEGVEFSASLAPATHLFLTGPIGLPVVPTNLGTTDKNQIYLKLSLVLQKDYDFSFLTGPCLHMPLNGTLCPVSADVYAFAFKKNGGDVMDRRSRPGDLIFNLASEHKPDRISRDQIFTHYGYSGVHVSTLNVFITYRYECNAVCPRELELDAGELASINSVSVLSGKYNFSRVRESEYRVVAPL